MVCDARKITVEATAIRLSLSGCFSPSNHSVQRLTVKSVESVSEISAALLIDCGRVATEPGMLGVTKKARINTLCCSNTVCIFLAQVTMWDLSKLLIAFSLVVSVSKISLPLETSAEIALDSATISA